jgi:hypothetical protein
MPRRPSGESVRAVQPVARRTPFTDVRLELLQHMFSAVAHELGNLSSPIGLIAESLAADTTVQRRESLAGTLTLVGSGMRELTAATRLLGLHGAEGLFAPDSPRNLARWWGNVSHLVNEMLPIPGVIACSAITGEVPPATLGTLTWVVPALVRGAALQCGDARTFSLDLRADDHARMLVGAFVVAPGCEESPVRRDARRWLGLARDEIANAGGAFVMAAQRDFATWHFTIPSPEKAPTRVEPTRRPAADASSGA